MKRAKPEKTTLEAFYDLFKLSKKPDAQVKWAALIADSGETFERLGMLAEKLGELSARVAELEMRLPGNAKKVARKMRQEVTGYFDDMVKRGFVVEVEKTKPKRRKRRM